ncbi:NAD(P)-binding domain-containing protein [Zymobacter sp. IVIA_5232.4 C2]|uniref:NAD(P)-binding domain-containing protein n=1 Tax=Zymobacter sp. IVIA_5232.4 C2 TaxID=3394855 RepID=UPI0039C36ED8
MPHSSAPPSGLPALEARLQQDLEWLALPAGRWTPRVQRDGQPVQDVVVIGAGMAGLAVAAALQLQGVHAVLYDRAARDYEGPWATIARMETLRSPKHLTGPALGLPSLTFRAWYEAQFGREAWDALDKIPRLQWMDYLRWYRRVLKLEVRNEHELISLVPRDDGVTVLTLSHRGERHTVLARHVVLALGMDAFGGPSLPDVVRDVPQRYWSHTSAPLDYAALKGKRVAVVGGSASAMDAAATSLEAGASDVEILIRRPDFPRFNRTKGVSNPGFRQGYAALPDAWKWQLEHALLTEQIAPPHGSTLRVSRHDNVWFNFSSPVTRIRPRQHDVLVHTPKGDIAVDHVILATGYRLDWAAQPAFSALVPHIRRWGDAFQPPPDQQHEQLAEHPYLNDDFSFQPRSAQAPAAISNVYCFCHPAHLSNGHVIGLIPGISQAAQTVAEAIVGKLYVDDRDHHYQGIMAYDDPELLGDEWTPAGPFDTHSVNKIDHSESA